MKMKRKLNRLLAIVLAAVSVLGCIKLPVLAEEDRSNVIINQVYGASDNGFASHSFIELYNTSDTAVDLSGWSLQYQSSESGNCNDEWMVHSLSGTIEAYGYYLVRCAAVTTPSGDYEVPAGNEEWDIPIHNKGVSVVLRRNSEQLTDAFAGDVTAVDFTMPEGIADVAAVQGNDGTSDQIPPAYEGNYADVQSKKKAIRRINYQDTNHNKEDFTTVDYSGIVSTENGPHGASTVVTPSYTPVETTADKYYGFFNNTAVLRAELIARYNSGAYSTEGGSAEISVYNAFNGFLYSVNGVKGTLDCIDLAELGTGMELKELSGTELKAAELAEHADAEFTYGDITSVTVSSNGTILAVALQDLDYTKNGRVLTFECKEDGTLVYIGMAHTGVQPDMVTFASGDTLLLTADEGEPRQGETGEDPKGSVTVIQVTDLTSEVIDFTSFDSQRDALTDKGIVIEKKKNPSVDFEPEYIAAVHNKAYVSLQEANAIAVLDLASRQFTDVYSVGFEDYSRVKVDLDKGDAIYAPANYQKIKGIRMPDGISICVINGETYLLTANEGDSRAWPIETEAYTNEVKSKTSPINGIQMNSKVTWFDTAQYDGLEADMDYIFGARSFTMFKVTKEGLMEVYDSGSSFEEITAEVLPEYFNCSNDVKDVEDRSGKKGPEPESVVTGQIGGRMYAFVGLERIGGVMMYDITNPNQVVFENYMNSRDFSGHIKNDVSPEGLCFMEAQESPNGSPILAVSNEVSGTIAFIALSNECIHKWADTFVTDCAATCTEDGIESIHCEKCGAVKESRTIPAKGHSFCWITDKEAAEGIAGMKHEECSVCGYKKEAVEIPALPIPDNLDENTLDSKTGNEISPKTGDDSGSNRMVLIPLCVIGTGAFGAWWYIRKKRLQNSEAAERIRVH